MIRFSFGEAKLHSKATAHLHRKYCILRKQYFICVFHEVPFGYAVMSYDIMVNEVMPWGIMKNSI